MATLAPDVEVVSPISGRMVFRWHDDVVLGPKVARDPGVVRRALT